MAIDAATVRRVARLARIAEPEHRLEPLAAELSGILAWLEQLNEVDVAGVADGGDASRVLANAPKAAHGFFVVPKVVE